MIFLYGYRIMFRSVKVRLYPTKEQADKIRQNIGCCRYIYNLMLAKKIEAYQKRKENIGKYELMKMLPELKKRFLWLKEADAASLQQSLIDMDAAYQNFFKHNKRFPKFKKKQIGYGSFRCVCSLRASSSTLKAGKHSELKFRCSDRDSALLQSSNIRNITVSEDTGLFYASCLIEVPEKKYEGHKFSICGIDLGIKKPVAVAFRREIDGRKVVSYRTFGRNLTQALANKESRRKRYQRQLARKQKGSNNRLKALRKLQRAFKKERDYRQNFVEQVSYRLAKSFAVISFENLNLTGMTKAVKKNEEGIRKGKAAKSGLNRSLLSIGMGALVDRTRIKASERHGQVVLVGPRFTSQICSCCGHKDKASRKSQALFVCTACGYKKNADYNAARNVLKRAA
jgi:putative transposase